MFDFIKEALFSFLNAPYIQNLSALIQALTAAAVGVYGLFSFRKWAKQKYLEKRSDYAEDALSFLEPAHEELLTLLRAPQTKDWDHIYSQAAANFKQGRRKATRIGDPKINGWLKKYEHILADIETNHIQRVDDMFMGKDKAIADERLSHSIEELQRLFVYVSQELTEKTLLSANRF